MVEHTKAAVLGLAVQPGKQGLGAGDRGEGLGARGQGLGVG